MIIAHTADASTHVSSWSYLICVPFWLVASWYWFRHYNIRYGTASGIIAAAVAFIFPYISIGVMAFDWVYRLMTGNQAVVGACPRCGKSKIVAYGDKRAPHAYQPQCPHCQEKVGEPHPLIPSP